MPTVRLIISGKVQGVFYRATAQQVAKKLGLTGWVRNCQNGDVEALASGNDVDLKAFVNWCGKGPAGALVTGVEMTELPETVFESFKIIK